MKPSQDCLDLLRHFEGFYPNAYRCPAGINTIGVGTIRYPNGKPVMLGDHCTLEQAEEYLRHELEEKAEAIRKMVTVPLAQHEFDAILSFAYNCGTEALRGSTLLKKLNAGDKAGAGAEFLKWTKGGGRVLPGLERRRKAEKSMFLGGNWKEFVA